MLHGVGDEVDAEFAAIGRVLHAIDRQAHAVDGDGAFVGHEFRQLARRQHPQKPAFTHGRQLPHLSDAVHMAGDDVTAQPVLGAQGFFQVHRAGR